VIHDLLAIDAEPAWSILANQSLRCVTAEAHAMDTGTGEDGRAQLDCYNVIGDQACALAYEGGSQRGLSVMFRREERNYALLEGNRAPMKRQRTGRMERD
jgi:hypothetical protein